MAATNRKVTSHATQFARTRGCTMQLACDGNTLTQGRLALGVCVKCEETAKKRGKVLPLRGENTAIPEYLRKKAIEAVEDQLDGAMALLGGES